MNESKIGNQKTIRNRFGTIAVGILLAVAMFAALIPVAEAKTYYMFYGHLAVRYDNADLAQWIRPYIDHVEYDMISAPGVGARLYFTGSGKFAAKYDYGANQMANYVMSLPEWSDDRSEKSVAEEIKYHAWWPNKWVVDIEYYCADLKSWEIYRVYC